MEQRKNQRFKLKLPLKIVRAAGRPISGVGETRNLCSRGVLFATSVKVDVGESVEFVITFPVSVESPEAVNLRCLGKILRLEESCNGAAEPAPACQMAASIERYEFMRERA